MVGVEIPPEASTNLESVQNGMAVSKCCVFLSCGERVARRKNYARGTKVVCLLERGKKEKLCLGQSWFNGENP